MIYIYSLTSKEIPQSLHKDELNDISLGQLGWARYECKVESLLVIGVFIHQIFVAFLKCFEWMIFGVLKIA